jgi:TfoX/Sxy family transcriptional regulator of competence genes
MAYDEGLVERIREVLGDNPEITEKKMFGGVAFMVRGNMALGLMTDDLMVRVGTEQYQKALAMPHTRKMDLTGKPMKGFVIVELEGYEDDKALANWVKQSVDYAQSLPAK